MADWSALWPAPQPARCYHHQSLCAYHRARCHWRADNWFRRFQLGRLGMIETTQGQDALFAGKDTMVRAIYGRLLDVVQTFGPFWEEPKKTSIHLVNTSGFAGIHPRKRFLYLN